MAEEIEGGIFREIEEELRQDKITEAWKAYGHYFIGVMVAIVIGVAGHQGWRSYDLSTRAEDGAKFAAASRLIETGPEGAIAAFNELAESAGSGYSLLARFQAAGLSAKDGDASGAAAAYLALANDSSIEKTYQDLAIVLGALQELNFDSSGKGQLISKLSQVVAIDNPWRFTAREITALSTYQSGDIAKAKELFGALAADNLAPAGMRSRAEEMLAVTGK